MTRRRKKPHDPAAAARALAERAENAAEVARLRALPDTTVNVDSRTGKLVGAIRMNCFAALLTAGGAEIRAVDWLEELIRTASGDNTPERRPDHIRASTEGAPGQNITADMIAAGAILEAIEDAMAPCDFRMLFSLLKPDASLMTRWRNVVQQCTGEVNGQAQGARVRGAAASLAHVRTIVDKLVWIKRERRRLAA
ncbi:hypothetical protein UFOVP679_42 [uncultured Caudovirales phage]|uniref:Uncharacterized protein n=1 Tax=uncultured Caudovirales phage TaxID=2100421 RepID=A0A6J5NDC4_9CAUD|nr:hypothetical protein UFOVP679_42 [uncultured Caudovirales phage]